MHAQLKAETRTLTRGLTRELVEHISDRKNEPTWMRAKRLEAYDLLQQASKPTWGPALDGLDLDTLVYYIDPEVAEATTWDDLPKDIVDTFNKLGIPKAEQEYLGGVGAQYDSGMVYHKLKEDLSAQGVIFENMDVALATHPDLVQQYFMDRCVPITDHYFVMMHAACWSGGTFIYVPKGVKVELP